MAEWAKGVDFKNSNNTRRVGGIGIYGTDSAVNKLYIGLGTEPWNNAGLQLTSSAINFKGNKIYHAGDKPTPAEIGAATSSHTHNYAGSSSAGGSANSAVKLATTRKLTIGNTGKLFDGSADINWSLSELGAAAASHTHNSLTIKGNNTINSTTNDTTANWGAQGNSVHWYTVAGQLTNQPSQYGYLLNIGSESEVHQLWMTQASGDLAHRGGNSSGWSGTWRTILDSSNYTSYAAAASHTHNYAGSSSAGGAANSANTLATARTINGTSFNGSANITTANWGTARTINGISVNGSTNYILPVENYYCDVGNDNTKLYHKILESGQVTGNWADKSITLLVTNAYQGGGHGIVKITLRTNDISSAANATGEIRWLVRSGLAIDSIVFNIINQSKNVYMDVFYKCPGTYCGLTWYVLSEGQRGSTHSKVWTKFNTSATSGAYTEADMKALRSYTATLQTGSDSGQVASANTLATARTINGTSFNGSGDITTANWGTARTLTIGSTGKSVNGSGNVSWSLSEIGALPWKVVTSIDCNATKTTGIYSINGTPTNAATTNHGTLIVDFSIGTPYQIWIPDNSNIMYKRNYTSSSNTWGSWNSTLANNISGNANTATTLQTARTINGTSFNGSANITTANWGTARNITIADNDGTNTGSAVSVNGSANVTLKLPATIKASLTGNASTATTSNYLSSNSRMDYNWNGVNYFNINGTAGNAAKANDTPTSAWWHVMRFNHANSSGFYTDLAIPFNDVSMYYKRITSGAVNNGGWVKMLDALNYNNYAPTKTGGGASGTWGISVSGNAATATKATQDSAGQQINTTYIKGLSVSGKTITYTKGDGTTGTITTQDTNTTYSTGTASALGLTKLYTGTGTATDGTMTQAAIKTALDGKANSSHTHNYAGSSSAGGSANTAVKLATARTISLNGDASGSTSFDGSGNVTITANVRKYCMVGSDSASSNGWYKVASQTMSSYGDTNATFSVTSTYGNYFSGILHLQIRSDNTSISCKKLSWLSRDGFSTSSFIVNISGMTWTLYVNQPQSQYGRIMFEVISQSSINSKDSGITLYNSSTKESTTPTATVTSSDGSTVAYANRLSSARNINGTSFNGSGDITTANWGTARTLTIGNSGKSVNGSGNVSWSLSEIGAASSSHTHNYAGSSSAGGSANTAVKLATARTINGTSFDGTANITTANWGTARNITIGNTKKSVNGSVDMSWSLSEIGAMAFDYSGEHLDYSHPRIFVPGKEWLRAPSGGLVPYKHQSGYLGLANKAWYDFHTVHINSKPCRGQNGKWWNCMVDVGNDGVTELGRYIDFHNANTHNGDYTYRLDANAGTLYHSGSLAQMSDRSLKENIVYIDESPIMLLSRKTNASTPFKDFIKDFKFAIYNYIEDVNKDVNFGFIAQDIENSDIGKLMLREYEKENIDKETSIVKSIDNLLAFDISSYITIVAKGLQEEIKSRDEEISQLKNELSLIKEKLGLQ